LAGTKAYILASCDAGSDEYVVNRLKDIDGVKEAHGTIGTYDVIAKIESENDEGLRYIISKKIRKISKIRATLTLIVDPTTQFGKNLSPTEKEVLRKFTAHAYVLIHCGKNDEENILHQLNDIPEVIEADCVFGNYEIICKVSVPVLTNITEIITKKIRKIENIKSTVTLNVIPENE